MLSKINITYKQAILQILSIYYLVYKNKWKCSEGNLIEVLLQIERLYIIECKRLLKLNFVMIQEKNKAKP